MNKYKLHSFVLLGMTLFFCASVSIITIVVDPLFHYHKPNDDFTYYINDERYQNDGILRNFEYDAIITGTSMSENFKTTELDNLFKVKSVKTPFSGGNFKEVNDALVRAVEYNPSIKMIVRSIDMNYFEVDNDFIQSNITYPTYLYDNNYFNDLHYLLNKSMFIDKVVTTLERYDKNNGVITSFNRAYNWHRNCTFGKAAFKNFKRAKISNIEKQLNSSIESTILDIVNQNFVTIAKDNPDIDFYYFIAPYSIYYWDNLYREKSMSKHIEEEKIIIETLLKYDNVYLYSFNDEFDMITNPNNYKDYLHYGEHINSYMLECMKLNEHLLTKENYNDYILKITDFYGNYDYNQLFK